MNNKRATKRALLTSVMALVMCVVMLVGTTFAWFTDTASTGVNKIQAGNLKMEVTYKNTVGGNFEKVNKETPVFNNSALWEPGHVEFAVLNVKNIGTLALKYKLGINIASETGSTNVDGGTFRLSDYIKFAVIEGDATETATDRAALVAAAERVGSKLINEGYTKESQLKTATDTSGAPKNDETVTLVVWMPTDVGNKANHATDAAAPVINLGINVVATQLTYENDSFNDQYDKDAEYPVYAVAPIEKGADGKLVGDVTLKTPEKHEATGNPVATATVPAGAKLDADANQLELIIEKSATPANFTVDITQNEPKTLDISMKGLAAVNDQLIKVEFYIETGLYLVEIDHNGTAMSRCSEMRWLDADQEFYYDSATGLVTMLTKTFSPFTYTSNKFQWDDRKADSYQTPVDTANKVITVNSAEELALFKYEVTNKKVNYNGYTLNITSDIDLGAGFWRPINPINNLTINGNGHIISNLLVRSASSNGYGFGFIGNATGKVTISDLTFDKADVDYYGNVGAVVLAYAYGTTEFNNVQVINSSLNGYGKIGMLLGMGADPGVKVTFKNCVSRDNTIRAVYNIGGLAGNIQRGNGVDNATVENCTVQNINVICNTNDYIDLNNVTVTVKSNDQLSGDNVIKTISGKYWISSGYYWGGYANYYVSYGNSSYDAPIDGRTEQLANSEYCVNQ